MTYFGYFVLAVVLFSCYIAYRIFDKILKKKGSEKGEKNLPEKIFVLFFVFLLVASINVLTMVLSYTFFWEKGYRTLSETKYEAVVIGYKKETTKTQNFRNSTYDSKFIYFPKVKYTNSEGKEIIKTVDMTSNHPPAPGQYIKITDRTSRESANAVELNWIVFIFGGIFTGIAAFFALLISSYITECTLKKRITLSLYGAFILCLLNISCVMLIWFKQ
ncbi:hypothetical protein JET18_04030 [Chryseobacterium sp. L7]|uniref:DUF3592 domain-containing protein n=1 Tax=Chryseobacterium endalhagicum TaxID=2797638 RepID=A0ABS1QCH6_9FLAO|nr:hypothetical protein [Chryseobacterium endalhagicum]MBL1219992.1 hypothetical protein [Chryseobacterium endalhagicum]